MSGEERLRQYIRQEIKRGMDEKCKKKKHGVSEKKLPSKNNPPDWHQHKIAVDHVKNPMKGKFLGGPSAEEAEEILRKKFKYSDKDIAKLKNESVKSDNENTWKEL